MNIRIQIKNFKTVFIAFLCLGLIACTVGGVYAYLVIKTDPISNEFVPAKVSCLVEEDFTDGVKSNVKVRNTGNIEAYIRATVVATFVSEDNKVLATAPMEGVDYTIQWAEDGWVKGEDGYWYHTKPVQTNETTAALIKSAQSVSVPSGYKLHIQILATGIQSKPDNAVQETWGVTVNNGEIVP